MPAHLFLLLFLFFFFFLLVCGCLLASEAFLVFVFERFVPEVELAFGLQTAGFATNASDYLTRLKARATEIKIN